tara:strand:- start:16 stop:207 length:192 start_codon:yes stop_codon:yes gene_type:complete
VWRFTVLVLAFGNMLPQGLHLSAVFGSRALLGVPWCASFALRCVAQQQQTLLLLAQHLLPLID